MEIIELGKKSWLAYVKSLIFSIFPVVMIGLILEILDGFGWLPFSSDIIDNVVLIGFIGLFLYSLWDISSYRLYYDEEGIWMSSGVLPWTKGVRGVKWRDLDSASYKINAIAWFTNSYDVILNHRYTKENEIYLSDMWKGNKMVAIINEEHNKLIVNSEIK